MFADTPCLQLKNKLISFSINKLNEIEKYAT